MNKQGAALLSILSNSLLIAVKVVAGVLSGSISVISEALHSAMDLVASVIAYFSVKHAAHPADEEHPYGHGKLENISGLFEAALLVIAAVFIVYESVSRLRTGAELRMPAMALGVMGVSAVVNLIVSRYLYRVARRTDSIALEADAKHLSADVYTSAGVFAGILLVMLTGYDALDAILAILVALYIGYEGIVISYRAVGGLIDTRLPAEEERLIREVLDRHRTIVREYHELRTRKAGSERHVDFHAVMCRETRITETHAAMDAIEEDLRGRFPDAKVLIHPEPCDHRTESCPGECFWTGHRLQSP